MLALAGLGVPGPQPPAVHAAPQAGGTFTVTSTADDTSSDSFLTLREALLVATGGTTAAGLNRPASAGEQAALAGCIFAAGLIIAGCGTGIADSIVFSSSLGVGPVITLTAALPDVTDSASTTIDGSVNGVFPIVTATGLLTGTNALQITSNNNALSGLTITGAPHDDLHLTGDSNQILTGTTFLAAGRYGLLVDGGKLNVIESALVGTSSSVVGACSQGNQQGGIIVANSATINTVQFATVACNSGFGVRFDGVGTTFNTITGSTVTAQSGNGIEIVNGAWDTRVFTATLTSNSENGILISGAATHQNVVGYYSLIGVTASGGAAGNGQYGVRVSAGTYGNQVSGIISGNGLGGVRLETGAISNTIASGIIGLNPSGTVAVPNGGPGVDVDNAPNSVIGFPLFVTIAGNLGAGVRFNNTDRGLVTFFNSIGSAGHGNGGPGVELINTTNTAVLAIQVAFNAGAGIAIKGASSTGNLVAPFFVFQNGGLPIDLGNDGHTPNDGDVDIGLNNLLEYPVITAASGSVITGTGCLNCTVLIYLATGNPAAPGGGATQLQTTTADGLGHWSATLNGGHTSGDVTLLACTAPCNHSSGVPWHSDTSEFSPRLQLWLPLVRR